MTDTTGTALPSPPSKWETYEMWAAKLTAALLTAAYLSGLIPTDGAAAKLAGTAATMLGFLGFTVMKSTKAAS